MTVLAHGNDPPRNVVYMWTWFSELENHQRDTVPGQDKERQGAQFLKLTSMDVYNIGYCLYWIDGDDHCNSEHLPSFTERYWWQYPAVPTSHRHDLDMVLITI